MATRPEVTADDIGRLTQMSVTEIRDLFPASYEPEYALDEIKSGGTFRAAITWDIATWDLRKAAAGGTTSVGNVVYERLVQFDQSTNLNPGNPAIVPDLAKSWEYNDDGTKLTLQLHEGMCWGDIDDPFECGPEIVAEDFVYIITELRDNSVQAGNYRTVENVEAPDKYTLVLNFDSPSFFVLPFLAGKDAAMFNPYLARADRMKNEIVGPGPFILVDQEKSALVDMKRNPNHFMTDAKGNQLPYLDGVKFIIATDANTRRALIRTGRVEFAASLGDTAREIQSLLKTNPDLQVFAFTNYATYFLVSYQMSNPMFQDINVRRAITLAIDGKGMGDVIFGGLGMPQDKIEQWWWCDCNPTWEDNLDDLYGPYQNHYDPEKAKELWAQAGLGDITLKFPFYQYSASVSDRAGLLVDDLRKLGITLKPQSQDYSDYNSSLQSATHDELIFSWQQQSYDVIGAVMTRLHSEGPGNREAINDPEIDKLADRLVRTGDPTERARIVDEIRDRYNDQVYWAAAVSPAVGFRNISQPYVKGMHTGVRAGMSYYYQGPILRKVWLDQ